VPCRENGVTLQQPEHLLETAPQETRAARSPWSWRVRAQHNGTIEDIGLLLALQFPDGKRRAFLVECDRGTMPVERSTLDQTSMLRKFLTMEKFPPLIVTPNPDRVATIRDLIQRTPGFKGSPIFLFADQVALAQSNVLTHQWVDQHGKAHTLI
jgi:hypothetical protein